MTAEEMINSDDIEVATLGAKLYHEKYGQTKLREILKNSQKYYWNFNEKEIILQKGIIYVNGMNGEFTFDIPYTL
jgi:hypothetical protein